MISGRQTLDQIVRALAEERAKGQDLDRRMAAASERILAIDVERGKAMAALAGVRVGHLATGAVGRLEGADRTAMELLQARAANRASIQQTLEEADARLASLEHERGGLADALEAASERVDAAEAATQARLEQDERYRAKRESAQAAERTAKHADEKVQESEAEREAKGRAFEADPTFMYLWRRGYGTSRYRAGPLTRRLDRWVARLIGYDDARANYARLVDIPVRLREHADAVAEAAREAFEALQRLDEEARAADGVDALEAEREAAAAALERHDAATSEAAVARQEAFDRLERIDRGEDETYAQAVATMAAELGREDVQELRRAALATPYPEDDAIVARLVDLEAERERLRTTLAELKGVAEASRTRLAELEALRHEFTKQQMADPGTSFPDRDVVTTMITQFLLGAATSKALWRVLEGQRRRSGGRSNPTFGSGGFGRGSPWTGGASWPGTSGRGRGGGGARPSGGSIPRGGFRTGGRIGGRGFKTGGKF
jgi:hypothetical protein